jgi:phage tail sheath protein FI
MAFIDNGDSKSAKLALKFRDPTFASAYVGRSTSAFNSRYIALYEPYTKVYDPWTAKDLWVPPTYHVSRIIGASDRQYEIWFPLAGINRGAVNVIKEMRYNPNLSDRDKFIRQQLNPIVRFSDGYALFSQRTTQRRPSSLQDINVVRLVLYIERALKRFCRGFIFELNVPSTWDKIRSEVTLFLNDVQTRGGLTGFSVAVYANEYDIRMRRVKVDVILQPVRAIEQIHLTFFVS